MLLVETYLAPSAIHGIGLFARASIRKGTLISRFQPGFDVELTSMEIARLSEPARAQVLKYAYRCRITRTYILCSDDERFVNHSDSPNVCAARDLSSGIERANFYAAQNIYPGEEITNDYREFDMSAADIPSAHMERPYATLGPDHEIPGT